MVVSDSGELDGTTVDEAGLRHLEGVFLVQIERDGDTITPVGPHTRLHGGDRLRFAGTADEVAHEIDIFDHAEVVRARVDDEQPAQALGRRETNRRASHRDVLQAHVAHDVEEGDRVERRVGGRHQAPGLDDRHVRGAGPEADREGRGGEVLAQVDDAQGAVPCVGDEQATPVARGGQRQRLRADLARGHDLARGRVEA